MKLPCLLTSCFLMVAAGIAAGQQASPAGKEPVPDAPLMAPAPSNTQWTITYAPKTPEKDPVSPEEIHDRRLRVRYSPQVLSKRVLKNAEGQMVTYTTYEAGLKSEGWLVNGYTYELPMREGEGIRVNARAAGDFPEVYWVNPENFHGTVDYKGTKVHLYETDAADTFVDPSAPPQARQKAQAEAAKLPHKRAYIDAKTRLPLFVDLGDVVLAYQYSPLTGAFPTPDDRVKKIMRDSAKKR